MTAEGDNSVLMQKVAKERLAAFKPNKVEKLKADVNDPKYLHNVLAQWFVVLLQLLHLPLVCVDVWMKERFDYFIRENLQFMSLGKKLMSAGKEHLFDTWMLKESDNVQAAAHAYGKSESMVVKGELFPHVVFRSFPLLLCVVCKVE